MVTNISDFGEYARAHHEVFEAIRPASSIVQVVRLVDPRLLVEIEVEAVRGVTECSSRRLKSLDGQG
jgi:enamine deaminase RidA (YjgF/YER057c/UK114 family)